MRRSLERHAGSFEQGHDRQRRIGRRRDRRPGSHQDRLRHGRLAGEDCRRLHIRQRAALRPGRGRIRRRSRRGSPRNRLRLRPTLCQRALRGSGRRGRPGPRHPDRIRRPRRADADVLIRGGSAEGSGGHRHHCQSQPLDRQRVQGQVADRRRRRAGDAGRYRGAHCRRRGQSHRNPALRRCGGRRPR